MIGVIIAALLGLIVALTLGSCDVFHYKAMFAVFAGAFGGLYDIYLLYKDINGTFSHEAVASILEYAMLDNRSLIVAVVGGAVGGYLVAAVMNTIPNIKFTQAVIHKIAAIDAIGRALIIRFKQSTVVLGTIGVVIGAYFGFIADIMVRGRLEGATLGAVMGAITGTISEVLAVIVTIVTKRMVIPTITLSLGREIKAGVVITAIAIGGIIGGIVGSHFTSNVVASGLTGLIFSIVNAAIAVVYIARQHHFKRIILVPLTDIVNNFGAVIRQGSLNNWMQYRITKAPQPQTFKLYTMMQKIL